MISIGDLEGYERWTREYDSLTASDREAIQFGVEQLRWRPVLSLVLLTPLCGPDSAVHAAVASVCAQIYTLWELWAPAGLDLWVGGDADKRIRTLPAAAAYSDPAAGFNAALAAARGDFVVPLPSDIILAEHALYELAAAVAERPDADLLYSDEDRLDAVGRRCHPRFKTAWDADLMLGCDAVGHLSAYSRALLRRLGGMRTGLPSLDLALYDLALRVGSEAGPTRICHVPSVVCHRRGVPAVALAWDTEGAREVVRRHLVEAGEPNVRVLPAPLAPGWNRVVRPLPDPAPLVSVMVPTRDRADLLERCTDAVLSRTDYAPLELLVVDNDSKEEKTLELLRQLGHDPRVRVIRHPGSFNYSALNNLAARQARGEVLVLLNNDTDAIEPGWMRELVSHAVRPEVGAVGAKLLYPDGRVQHAGVVLGPDGSLTHQLRLSNRTDPGPGGELALARTVSAVTGACLALRRSVFFEVGGLDEQHLAVAFNDVDLCLRIGDRGYKVVWTPFAELLHLESGARGLDDTPEKRARMMAEWAHLRRTWGALLEADPFHNPNLIFRWEDSVLATPPRRERPWQRYARPPGTAAVPSLGRPG